MIQLEKLAQETIRSIIANTYQARIKTGGKTFQKCADSLSSNGSLFLLATHDLLNGLLQQHFYFLQQVGALFSLPWRSCYFFKSILLFHWLAPEVFVERLKSINPTTNPRFLLWEPWFSLLNSWSWEKARSYAIFLGFGTSTKRPSHVLMQKQRLLLTFVKIRAEKRNPN